MKISWLLIGLALLVSLPISARIIDGVVAVVNDEVITLSEVEDLAKAPLARLTDINDPKTREAQRRQILLQGLDQLIGKQLMVQEASRRQITIDSGAVDAHIKRVQQQQGWTDEQMNLYITSQGLSTGSFRKAIKQSLLEQRVIGIVLGSKIRISENELEDFYKGKRTQASGEYEVSAAHIVLKVRTGATPAEEAAIREQASALLVRAQAGEDFTALAKQHSQGPSASTGGSLGTLKRGSLEPKLENAIFSLKKGEIGGPYRSPFGYHVIRVSGRQQLPPKPFAAVKNELRRELRQVKIQGEMKTWIKELRTKAFVDVRLGTSTASQ
jgi:peptidyl-prolyl cis-trans isomerase SurA